ncbi:hypothetical protein BJ165DRAFT_179596 [Panaeolus papilionaceus]|nr:hypothetical protein BJ165DRAFT_179596 [Panaeolus papilionaceus]
MIMVSIRCEEVTKKMGKRKARVEAREETETTHQTTPPHTSHTPPPQLAHKSRSSSTCKELHNTTRRWLIFVIRFAQSSNAVPHSPTTNINTQRKQILHQRIQCLPILLALPPLKKRLQMGRTGKFDNPRLRFRVQQQLRRRHSERRLSEFRNKDDACSGR